jgi:hypothetical protein
MLAGRPLPPVPELVPAAVPRWRRVIGRTRA